MSGDTTVPRVAEPVPAPPINFRKFTFIVAALGMQAYTGSSVNIISIRVVHGTIRVAVQESVPGKGCTVTDSFINPVTYAFIPKTDKQVNFDISRKTVDCLTQ